MKPNLKHCRPLRSGERIRKGDIFVLCPWSEVTRMEKVPGAWLGDRYHRVTHPQIYRKKGK